MLRMSSFGSTKSRGFSPSQRTFAFNLTSSNAAPIKKSELNGQKIIGLLSMKFLSEVIYQTKVRTDLMVSHMTHLVHIHCIACVYGYPIMFCE